MTDWLMDDPSLPAMFFLPDATVEEALRRVEAAVPNPEPQRAYLVPVEDYLVDVASPEAQEKLGKYPYVRLAG